MQQPTSQSQFSNLIARAIGRLLLRLQLQLAFPSSLFLQVIYFPSQVFCKPLYLTAKSSLFPAHCARHLLTLCIEEELEN